VSIRSFKQFFSVVFSVILGGLLLTVGLNMRSFLPPKPSTPTLIPLWDTINDLAQTSLWVQSTALALGIVGLLAGAIAGPKLAQSLVNAGNAIENMSARDKIAVGVGTFLGVVVTLPFFLLLLR